MSPDRRPDVIRISLSHTNLRVLAPESSSVRDDRREGRHPQPAWRGAGEGVRRTLSWVSGDAHECSSDLQSQGLPQPPQEQPPPYVEGSSRPTPAIPSPGMMRSNSVFQSATQQPVNFITLESKHNTISGG